MSRESGLGGGGSFVLMGEIEGVERRIPLLPGLNRVGCLETSEVSLQARGISKRHALIEVRSDQLSVEDLASKNGTFLNGARVESTPLASGDELGFGAVRLRLKAVSAVEGALAITARGLGHEDAPEGPGRETSNLPPAPGRGIGDRWMEVLDGFVKRLFDPRGAAAGERARSRLVAALAWLARSLGARGALVMELTADGSRLVRACYGNLDELSLEAIDFGDAHGRRAFSIAASGGHPLAVVSQRNGGALLALVLWGEFPSRDETEPLLSPLLRILREVLTTDSGSTSASRAEEPPGLRFPAGYVIGQSPAMARLHTQMQPVSRSDLPILLSGETGVGKEWIARILHASSDRRHGPLVAINCAAIPGELLEAELFGIGKRVATGVAGRRGKFQQASGGTLFLDEIGDMSPDLQAKLLRALEEQVIHPVGREPVGIDVRLIAATNTDLAERIETGAFRRDLYYRLAGFVLHIPPLCERREDIASLTEHFFHAFCRKAGKHLHGVTLGALQLLIRRPWPGNVRELEHEIQRLVLRCPENQAIDSSLLSGAESPAAAPHPAAVGNPDSTAQDPAPSSTARGLDLEALDHLELAPIEARVITEALRRCRGNRTRAARQLGISRGALRRRIARLGIDPTR